MIETILALSLVSLAQRPDEQVQAAIDKALSKDRIELQVAFRAGTATLTGKVRNVFQKNRGIEIALAEPEVQNVDADIEIALPESDPKLGEEVVKEIRKYSRFTVFDDCSALVNQGKVTLFGWVTEPYKKTEIEKRLHKVIGIQEFKNDIVVLPVSTSDQRLRETLWNRIYRDSTFSDYASMPIPPIHIIVSGSRVILTGVVGNQLQKQKAESIVRGTPGVLSLESQLRIES
jgi:osmotically-inducible protein OsmY